MLRGRMGWTIPSETASEIIERERRAGRGTLTLDQVVDVCVSPSLRTLRVAQNIAKGKAGLEKIQRLRAEAKARAVLYHISGTHVKVSVAALCTTRCYETLDVVCYTNYHLCMFYTHV